MIIPFNFGKEIATRKMSDEKYEEISVYLKLDKNIAQLVKIFANIYAENGSTEEKRIDNFLSEEVTKIIQALAPDPPQSQGWPESLKQHIQNLLHQANNSNKDLKEDSK